MGNDQRYPPHPPVVYYIAEVGHTKRTGKKIERNLLVDLFLYEEELLEHLSLSDENQQSQQVGLEEKTIFMYGYSSSSRDHGILVCRHVLYPSECATSVKNRMA